ncbi:MAG: hypothetical protein KGL39_53025, partial [Patescibacteria group bacterium]|nr:hypothetical protein [Patescibacteria group bacterium]
GTTNMPTAIWLPSAATLLLPPAFASVIAIRTDSHAMNVASLESYFRSDTDWLDLQGEPTQFQVLSPVLMEWSTAQSIYLLDTTAADQGIPCNIVISPDGIAQKLVSLNPGGSGVGSFVGTGTKVISASHAAMTGNPVLNYYPSGFSSFAVGLALTTGQVVFNPADNNFYTWTGAAGTVGLVANDLRITNQAITQTGTTNGAPSFNFKDDNGNNYGIAWTGAFWSVYEFVVFGPPSQIAANPGNGNLTALPTAGWTNGFTVGYNIPQPPAAGWTLLALSQIPLPSAAGAAPVQQRVRLTSQPTLSTNLRILGKTTCPILGPYDNMPINNVEPAVMAYARGDMLRRARQNGKGQLADQEGAALLAQLITTEVFQQAADFRIEPSDGFGGSTVTFIQPNSLHPL